MSDYLEKLKKDLLEQFRGKTNIEVFQKALARQLENLYRFFYELCVLRSLQTAEGTQLDGIGDIVVLTRAQALIVSKTANQPVPMNDETYRLYLAWKINLNTSSCTHRDVYQALKMFWDKPIFYSEDPNYPATIFLTTPMLLPEDNAGVLLLAPKIKAAGVALKVTANTETPNVPYSLRIGSVSPVSFTVTKLPQLIFNI